MSMSVCEIQYNVMFLIIPGVYWQEGGNDKCVICIWRVWEKMRGETVYVCVSQRESHLVLRNRDAHRPSYITIITHKLNYTHTHTFAKLFHVLWCPCHWMLLYPVSSLPLSFSLRQNESLMLSSFSISKSIIMNECTSFTLERMIFFFSYFASFSINVVLANSSLANM